MAAAPMNDERSSDHQRRQNEPKTPKSEQAVVTIALLPPSKASPPLPPFTPSAISSGKRKRLKPSKYEFLLKNGEKKHSPIKHKVVDGPVKISAAMIRAGEIQSSLGTNYPSFMKQMVRSHVISCFWMGIPTPFCRSFLPEIDTFIVIEDENGKKYNLKYLAHRTGLSGGWGKFARLHKLLEGDVLIFQLVEPIKFKVYIVRGNESKQVDGARDLLNLNPHEKQKPRAKVVYKRSGIETIEPPTSELRVNSEARGGSAKPDLISQDLKTFKDFHIMVNTRCIDSELTEEIRMNYYNLCNSKKELLHDNLPEGLYYKLVAGMIGETVHIAKALKICKPATTKEEFDTWDSSLKSFELLGMRVGFLRDRIRVLQKIAFRSEEDLKRYVEVKEERDRNEEMIKILEAKIVDLKESNRKIDVVLGSLKEKVEGYEFVFQKEVNAPW